MPTITIGAAPAGQEWQALGAEHTGEYFRVEPGSTVRYGAGSAFYVQAASGAVWADNTYFEGDPAPGVGKVLSRAVPVGSGAYVERRPALAFLGDSITNFGLRFDVRGVQRAVMVATGALMRTSDALTQAVPGHTTVNALDNVQRLIDLRPAYMAVLIGTNDFPSGGLTLAQTTANLQTLWGRITAAGIKVFAGTVMPRAAGPNNDRVKQINDWIRGNYSNTFGVQLWDSESALVDPAAPAARTSNPAMFPDGLHPNQAGAQAAAVSLAALINTSVSAPTRNQTMARWNAVRRARINLKTTAPEHVAATVGEFAGQPATVEVVDSAGVVRASGAAAVSTDTNPPGTRLRGRLTVASGTPAGTPPAEVRIKVAGGDELVAFSSGVGVGEIPFRKPLRAGQRIDINLAIPVPARLAASVPAPVATLLAPSINVGVINATTIRISASPAGSAATAVQVFRKSAANGERTQIGTITPPATSLDDTGRTTGTPLWYDAVSVDAAGNESPFSAERSATPQTVTGALVTTVAVHNPATNADVSYTGAAATDTLYRFGVPLQQGDIPAGASIQVRDNDGTTILPCQQDQESTWPQDGSLAFAVVTVRLTGTQAVGATRTLQIWRNSVAPSRTPNVTAAQITSSSDFKIEVTDGSFGSDVLSVSLNRILAEGQAAATTGATRWGANPVRGWERIRSGPLCTTYHAWEVLRRDSDGARHKQIRGDLYVTSYGSGVFEVFGLLTTPNCDGAFAGATLGDDLPHRKDGVVRLRNGATVIRQLGGDADPRKTDYPSSGINTADSTFNGSTLLDTGMPVRVSSTGTLPAGVSANTTYFVKFEGGTKRGLYNSRRAVTRNEFKRTLTSTGSGTITLTPMVSMFFLSPVWLCGTDMRADWVGAAKPPELLIAYDHAYLTTKTRAVPMYRNDPSLYPSNLGYAAPYYPNLSTQDMPWGLSGTGDGGRDPRIGYLSVGELVGLILHPHNLQSRRYARHMAHWVQEWGYDLMNPATGETVNVSDKTIAGLGTARPTYVLKPESTGIMGSSNPSPLQTMHQQGWEVMDAAATGKTGGYQEYIDGSHLPNYWTGQYIQSGEPWFLRGGIGLFACLYASLERNENWAGIETGPYGGRYGTVFYGIKQGQVRSKGWAWRTAGFVHHLAPDGHPAKEYARQSLEHAIALYADAAKPDSNAFRVTWKRNFRHLENSGEDIVGGFQHGFWSQGWAMLRWRGYYPRIEEAWSFWKRAAVGIYDNADPLDGSANGCAMLVLDYFIYNRRKTKGGPDFDTAARSGYTFNPATDQLTTYKRVFDWRNTFAPDVWPLPLVQDNSFACNPNTMDAGNYTRLQRAALAMHAVAGDTQARKVYNDINAATAGRLSFNNEGRQAIDIPAGM